MKKLLLALFTITTLFTSCSTTKHRFDKENLNLRTTFEETIATEEHPALDTNQKLWLVALPAIIMSSNKSQLDTLEVAAITDSSIDSWKTVLSRDWGINDREDLLETISHMEYTGHNDTFLSLNKLIKKYDSLSVYEITKIEPLTQKKQNYYSFLLDHAEEYADVDLIAWDLGRMTSLIRWGYQVGFLTENESWNMLLYFGNKIQKYYDSWEEYGNAYKLGRIFWASGFGKEETYRDSTKPIVEELFSEDGFWTSLKWQIKLPEPNIIRYSDNQLIAMEQQIKETDRLYNVSARKYKTVYFDLGNHHLRNNNLKYSYELYTKALRLDSYDWETQIRMAKIEYLQRKYSQVSGRLNHILRNCNDRIILSIARDIQEILPSIEEQVVPDNYDKILLIHTFDYIPDYILNSLKSRIGEEFKIRVWSGHEELGLSEKDFRSPQYMLNQHINRIVNDFKDNRKNDYLEILNTLGFEGKTELTDREKYEFVQYLYNQSAEGQKIWPDLINRMTPQYNAQVLRNELNKAYAEELKKPNVVGVLGLTLKDMYAQDYNFLFGWNGPESAVMSLYRFYTNETPLTTVIKRSVNQSFSSTGFILGIPRCTVANCARAYPHSLEEHDLKEDILCSECRQALIELYNQ